MEEKISRRIYIIVGLVLCFSAVIMYRVENNAFSITNDNIKQSDEVVAHNEAVKKELEEQKEKEEVPEVQEEVKQEGPMVDLSQYTDESYWNVTLVNKVQTIPADRPVKLGTISTGKQVDYRIVDSVNAMLADAKKDKVSLIVASAYRSYSYQNGLFNKELTKQKQKGLNDADAEKAAWQNVAKPGTSEHQLGLALDIVTNKYTQLEEGFENTDAFRWLNEHAADYGFILRYLRGKEDITGYTYEPWHWRYVGPELAKQIKESGLCYEEFLGKVPNTNEQ